MGMFIGCYYLTNGTMEYRVLDLSMDEMLELSSHGHIVKYGRWYWIA